MGFFRSNKILHLRIRMPNDIDGLMRIMDIFGKADIAAIQFINLTKDIPDSKKSFTSMLKRVEQMEIKTTQFMDYASEFQIKIHFYKNYDKFIEDIENDINIKGLTFSTYFDYIESEVIENEKKILDLIESHQKMKEDLEIELEKKLVFEKYFKMTGGLLNNYDLKQKANSDSLISFMGVIRADDEIKMNRMILRMGRGRAIATFFDMDIPQYISYNVLKKKDEKKIFIVIFPTEAKEYLMKKMLQICDILSASHYIPPENETKEEILRNLEKKIRDKRQYIIESETSIKKFLKKFSGNEDKPARMDLLRLYSKKEKMIYTNLNKCIIRDNFVDGEVWVLEEKKDILISLLNSGVSKDEMKSLGTFIEINENVLKRPTYIPTNEFTYAFQEIVNTYGVPRYREINPAIFNIVFFPFLFGVMFGDIGHGLIIFLFAMYLVYYNEDINKKEGKSPLKLLTKFRYFLLLLSVCSIYCGLLYNEFMSVPLSMHDTCYERDRIETKFANKKDGCNFPFGMDPKWFVAENQLTFFNSFKMKFSVVIGVIHMMLGIFLKGLNDNYYKNIYGIIFEFFPQFIFMAVLLGYMVVLIFIKWSTYFYDTSRAPSIITHLINLAIKGGSVENMPLWGNQIQGTGRYQQENFHAVIIAILVILIPVMILPKPFLDYKKYKKKKDQKLLQEINNNNNNINEDNFGEDDKGSNGPLQDNNYYSEEISNEHERNKSFVDFFIGQVIYSIEFILGTVSNTASYLRLWALSLAHAELSKVFFEKTLKQNISDGDYYFGLGFVLIFVGYFVLANMTIFVLIGMDFMECFLHTLRLHWVEFQNKFYYADGYLFQPYSFKRIIQENIQ
jgi:V-type H+-transporting ATPase subunit a